MFLIKKRQLFRFTSHPVGNFQSNDMAAPSRNQLHFEKIAQMLNTWQQVGLTYLKEAAAIIDYKIIKHR